MSVICVQQPLLALVSLAITPLLSRLLRAVVVRSSAIIFSRQQVRGGGAVGVGGPLRCSAAGVFGGACATPLYPSQR